LGVRVPPSAQKPVSSQESRVFCFKLSWQIIPKQLDVSLNHPDPAKAKAAMDAMMGMSKLIVSELQAAVL
jgi:hypothetical protein